MTRWVKLLGGALFGIALINFTLFWIIGVCLGGDALNGTVEEGRYYLANHGELTEVSEAVWQYSYYHAISVCITHPLGIFSVALAGKLEQKGECS